jgi:hypothetical protein
MITLDCAWCDAEVRIESVDADRVDCPDCLVSVEFAPDPAELAVAA